MELLDSGTFKLHQRSALPRRSRILDAAVSFAVLAGVIAYLCWICSPIIRNGLSNGDDGYFALAAKAVSSGTGYGIWVGSGRFSPFEPSVGTGPGLILPIAAVTYLAGPVDWLPGAATLTLFLAQVLVFAVLLSRIAPWPNVSTFVACGLLTLMLCSFLQWPFGVLVGEAVALGYLLIGLALLGTALESQDLAWGGLALGLAFLTKQISLFATAGFCAAWFVYGLTYGSRMRSSLRVILGFLAPVAAFELLKLFMTGWTGYVELTTAILRTTKSFAVGGGSFVERVDTFLTMVRQTYFDPIRALVVIVLALATTVALSRTAGRRRNLVAVMLWAGVTVHTLYFVVASTLWARYLWIAVGLGCFGAAVPILMLRAPFRYAALAAYGVTFWLGVGQSLGMMRDYNAGLHEAEERRQALAILDARQNSAVLAPDWGAFFDLFYLSNVPHGWYFSSDPKRIEAVRGRPFVAVSHTIFTDHDAPLDKAVHAVCDRLNPEAKYIALFECDERFWTSLRTP